MLTDNKNYRRVFGIGGSILLRRWPHLVIMSTTEIERCCL